MKLVIDYIDSEINISNEYVSSLEIENKNYFYRIVNDLNLLSLGELSETINFYDKSNSEINLNNKINVVIDYFNFDFNSKNITNKLCKSIKDSINIDEINKLNVNYNKIKKIISNVLNEYDFKLSLNDDFDIENVIKLLKVSVEKGNSILENLFLLVDIENKFKLNYLIVLVNLKQYLSKEELTEFFKYSLYNGINVLLLDSQSYGTTLNNEKKIIIDSNLDEFLL